MRRSKLDDGIGAGANPASPAGIGRSLSFALVLLVILSKAASADDAAGYRFLREQDPPRAGRAVPGVPFRLARETQGALAAGHARGDSQGRHLGAGGRAGRHRGERPVPGDHGVPTATSRCRPREAPRRGHRRLPPMDRDGCARPSRRDGLGRSAARPIRWPRLVVAPADPEAGRPAGPARDGRLGTQPDRPVRPRQAGGEGPAALARGRPAHA